VQHLVRELGSTDNEHRTGYRTRQREQRAAGASPPRQGLQRPALKRDRVHQSRTTGMPFPLASRTTGLSGEVTASVAAGPGYRILVNSQKAAPVPAP